MYKGFLVGTFCSTHTHKLKWNHVSWSDSWFFINQKAPQFQWCWFVNPPFWGRSVRKFCSKTDVWLGLLRLYNIYNISQHPQTTRRIYSSHCLKVRHTVVGRGDEYCSVYCRQGCGVVLPSLEVLKNVLGRYNMIIEYNIFVNVVVLILEQKELGKLLDCLSTLFCCNFYCNPQWVFLNYFFQARAVQSIC